MTNTEQQSQGGSESDTGPPGWPAIFYLWHLEAMNVLARDDGYRPPAFWEEPKERVRVAIVDSGCATGHPNLPAGAIESAIDVAPTHLGAIYGTSEPKAEIDALAAARGAAASRVNDVVADLPAEIKGQLIALAGVLLGSPPEWIETANPAESFAGHGTACAGLVAGRHMILREEPMDDASDGKIIDHPSVLPYFGVNPFATIIPIATPYSHEIRPLIAALLHAIVVDADVVLMPRAANDLELDLKRGKAAAPDVAELRATRIDQEQQDDKELFEALLGAVAAWRPVVVASGNGGHRNPEYPSSLVDTEAPDLIVVGAANETQRRSSYSSGSFDTGVSTYGPSDDEERADEIGIWYDRFVQDAPWTEHALGLQSDAPNMYSPYGVLAIDVPARTLPDAELTPGYDPARLPLRALYSRFGGTSAACSLVAGALSLAQMSRKNKGLAPLSGRGMKQLLERLKPAIVDDPGSQVSVLDVPALVKSATAEGE